MAGNHILDELVSRLQKAFEGQLISVVLYGSAAAGERHERFSDYNVLCVLDQVTSRELARAEQIVRWFRERGNPAPLLLSEAETAGCTDCFAIEFSDIQAQHRVLYGRDVISAIEVDTSFYRAQVEHELRAKLLRLRQKAAGVLSENDLLRRLLVDSVSTFCTLFRHALLLSGHDGPVRKREIVARAAQAFGFDPKPFEQALDVREDRIKLRDFEAMPALDGYLRGISLVAEAVDRLEK
jgi:hypothetical protein